MRRITTTMLLCLFFVALMATANASGTSNVFVPFGVNFSPYRDGQDPSTGLVIKSNQVVNRLKGIKGCSQWVRTFSSTHGLQSAGAAAHQLGFKTAVQAWLGSEATISQQTNNRAEIDALIAAANRGEVDMAIVGSEVLLRGDLTENQLISYMRQVRASIPNKVPVTTDEVGEVLLAHPATMAECDLLLANFYPYWEGIRIDSAIASVERDYQSLVLAAGPKEVWIGETGWPSAGRQIHLAVPNIQNAAYYFAAFHSWAKTCGVKSFYFEAYDEAWKVRKEGRQGGHWGIRNSEGGLKTGMSLVYAGYTLPPEVFRREVPASTIPGSARLKITKIPAYGSADGIAGVVSGVQTDQYVVATYIHVFGGWWTKPTWSNPTVRIGQDGRFAVNTVTGGNDRLATQFMVFLVPASYRPPVASGGGLPGDIYSQAVAYDEVLRPVGFRGSVTSYPVTGISSLTVSRTFTGNTDARDAVILSGSIPLESVPVRDSTVSIQIGSLRWDCAPMSKIGVAMVHGGSAAGLSGKVFATGGKKSWHISATLSCPADHEGWITYGLVNATIPPPGVPVFIPVSIAVNGVNNLRITSGYYKAQASKTGKVLSSSAVPGAGL